MLGAANDSLISGVLVLRGQDHQAVVEVAPDWESYEYKKLDIYGNEEDKKYFESALAWDLSVDGKAWADGKNVSGPLMIVSIANGYIDHIFRLIVQVTTNEHCSRRCLGGFLLRRSLTTLDTEVPRVCTDEYISSHLPVLPSSEFAVYAGRL